ncbi:glycosyltransferase [Williamsia sp. SKLECPSW1]
MTTRPTVALLLSKDPVLERGGDVELSRLLMTLAADSFDVTAICLSQETGTTRMDLAPGGVTLHRVRKPEIAPAGLARRALLGRRSLVHVRFDSPELRTVIETVDADVYLAEHSYMAESFLASRRAGTDRLAVNTHVSESLVWRATRGVLGRVEAPRLVRDELRVARAADAVSTFDAQEADEYRAAGVRTARWLDLTLPPGDRVEVADTPPRLVFLGTRDWPPNQEAFERAAALWPRIGAGIPGAELCVVGGRSASAAPVELPTGVRDLGFVDDLHGFLATCRGMVAPISTGGGVRVKFLDAARIGLPVVGTPAAVGSLDEVFGLDTCVDDDALVAAARRLLTDAGAAAEDGRRLYEVNEQRWRDRRPHAAVRSLLSDAMASPR